jgi:hypothetical protein
MRITGTFLDEISFDIPHQNWGRSEWDRDFAAMKAMGITRVFLIRCACGYFMTYPSQVLARSGTYHRPPLDLIDLFLDLAEKHELEFFAGTCHHHPGNCGAGWSTADFAAEIAFNKAIIEEIQGLYGHRKAFAGWYLTHEVRANDPGVIELFVEQGRYAKQLSGGKPNLISPYFAGVKGAAACGEAAMDVLSPEAHGRHWDTIFQQIAGAVDYVAFQDGHVDYPELAEYLRVTREMANQYGITCWSNVESFDRDMPIRFPPIKWEKFLWKLEAAEAAGIQEGITFEFSHFMSPNSCYPQAAGLFDRYCEYHSLPARARDFKA